MKLHAPTAEHRSPHRTSGRLGISLIAAAFVLVAGACSSGDDSSSSTTAEAGATDDAVAGSKELTIKFNDSALETIAETNQHVVVTRAAEDSDPSSAIAWTVFSPLESNSVTWTPNTVSVYASSSEDQNGAKLDVESSVDAQLGDTLKFNSDRTWTNTGSGGPTTGI